MMQDAARSRLSDSSMFRQIKGQDHVIQILQAAIDHDRIAHAYLFHGPAGVGKYTTALYFGMALNCLSRSEFRPCGVCSSCLQLMNLDHPDLIYLFPTLNLKMSEDGRILENLDSYEGYIQNKKDRPWQEYKFNKATEIRRESVAFLIRRLSLSIYDAKYRICLIEDADAMNIPTANAFLKTLEEPPANTVMLLTTTRLSALLPTILSRCQPIYFKPLSRSVTESLLREKLDYDLGTSRSAARIAGGNFELAVKIAEGSSLGLRELAFQMVDLAREDKELEFLNLLDSLKDEINSESIQHLFFYLGFIANDLAVIGSNPDEITNIDKAEKLSQFTCSHEDLASEVFEFLTLLEDYQRKAKGNVNLRLLMHNSYFALRRLLKGC